MDYFQGLIDLLRNDGSIIVNKNLAFAIGLENAIVYSELVSKYKYFIEHKKITDDGYFYNTVDNFRYDTTLTDKRQRKAIKQLEKLNLIETDLRGLPPKRHFRINPDTKKLLSLIGKGNKERLKLKEKQAENADISKNRYFEGIESSQVAETNTPDWHVNNTKPNNTRINNTKKENLYTQLKLYGYETTDIYNHLYEIHFDREHPKVLTEKLPGIRETLLEILSGYGKDFYISMIKYHMTNCIQNYSVDVAEDKSKIDYFVAIKDKYLLNHFDDIRGDE